ncbi:MAG: nicotinate-nucleotide adenylyltransferase [Verrucomicrobiota bacterium]
MIAKAKKHIGIYGGSFDPIHIGHLIVAQDCIEQFNLDEVVLVPAAASPLKSRSPRASDTHRINMVSKAVENVANFSVSDIEIKRGGVSYSIDTVEAFRRLHPEAVLYWILGRDQVNQLEHWHQIEDLVRAVKFLAVERPGFAAEDMPTSSIEVTRVRSHAIEISSTEIRDRFQHGLPNDLFLPRSVLAYIEENALYRADASENTIK